MQILLTGGAGFIGANLVRKLLTKGHQVRVYDNLSTGEAAYLPDPKLLIPGDILDRDALAAAMRGAAGLIHLAAFGSVVESVEAPWPNFEVNARGTLSVLDCARSAGVKRVIFASTGGALIGDAIPPIDEASLPKPISPYGASKLCGEAYCNAYAIAYGLSTVVLRFANIYGPFSTHKNSSVTRFIKCLLTGQPMPIYGDGSATRDYLHVQDLCDGIVQALSLPEQAGETFHLCSGQETSVLDLARLLARIAGSPDHPVKILPCRKGEVMRSFARYDRARDSIGFMPQIDLETGLRRTWQFFLSHREQAINQAHPHV